MDAMQKNVFTARGDALAAGLLGEIALRLLLMHSPNRDALFKDIYAFVDDVLNRSGPAQGNANDEVYTLIRETARAQVMQRLDAAKRSFDHPGADD